MKRLAALLILMPDMVVGEMRVYHVPHAKPAANTVNETVTDPGLAMFRELCKTAGKKVYGTVRSETGIRLDTTREARADDRFKDRNWSGAGLPLERVGDDFIASFLDFYFNDSTLPMFAPGLGGTVMMQGFNKVDVKQADGSYQRYTLAGENPYDGMVHKPVRLSEVSRYAVDIVPLETPEQRLNWIAGVLVKVTDVRAGKVLGQIKTYSYALPAKERGAYPENRDWSNRLTCPDYRDIQDAMVRISLIGVVDSKPH